MDIYVMVLASRQPFMQNKTYQVTFKVGKADRSVTQNVCWFLVYQSLTDEIYKYTNGSD